MRTQEKDIKLKEILGEEQFIFLENKIKEIEGNKFKTTKNSYGDYMNILSQFGEHKKQFALILIYFGGNIEGIKSALEVLN